MINAEINADSQRVAIHVREKKRPRSPSAYKSEHAIPECARRTAIGDLIGLDTQTLTDCALHHTLEELLHYERRGVRTT